MVKSYLGVSWFHLSFVSTTQSSKPQHSPIDLYESVEALTFAELWYIWTLATSFLVGKLTIQQLFPYRGLWQA